MPPPSVLSSSSAQARRSRYLEFLRLPDEEKAQTRPPDMSMEDAALILPAVQRLFAYKCAFCERKVPTQLYLFRPMSNAEPRTADRLSHIHYGWLADTWQNLFAICKECRSSARNTFPVESDREAIPTAEEYQSFIMQNSGLWPFPLKEASLLLDPCLVKDFGSHFFVGDDGIVVTLSKAATQTVDHFRLNRKSLVEQRKKAFAAYRRSQSGPSPDDEFFGLWSISADRREDTPSEANVSLQSDHPEPKHARLQRITLQNFRSIQSLSLPVVPSASSAYASALLVLGENSCGKSSIMEAICLAMMSEADRQNLPIKFNDLVLNPRYLGAPDASVSENGLVELTFDDGNQRTLTIAASGADLQETAAAQPIFAYSAYRQFLTGEQGWMPGRSVCNFFKPDELLSNPEAWLLGLTIEQFDEVVRALRFIFGAAEKFQVIEINRVEQKCYVVSQIDNDSSLRTPLSAVSSGFRTILALACDVMRWTMDENLNPDFKSLEDSHGIVLIDEVEAHLHPRWKIQIIDGLRRALPKMTYIITSHDPLCLRGMRKDEVVVLTRVRGNSRSTDLPTVIEAISDLPDPSQLTVEQLLTSDLFGLYSTDDPLTERKLAHLGDYLAKRRSGETPNADELTVAEDLRRQIASSLPVGLGEATRIIQEAVGEFLVKRKRLDQDDRDKLRADAKAKILAAFEEL